MTTTRKQKWERKLLYDRFKRLINNISLQKTWTRLRKGNLKRETESLLIAAQDNAKKKKKKKKKKKNISKRELIRCNKIGNVGYAVTETK